MLAQLIIDMEDLFSKESWKNSMKKKNNKK